MSRQRTLRAGLVAGAAGTLALEAATYLDMAVTGRPRSDIPDQAAGQLARALRLDVTARGGEAAAAHRRTGMGALLGHATGTGLALVYALIRGRTGPVPTPLAGVALAIAAMAAGDLPPILSGTSDPRRWGARGWLSDLVPHLAYGLVTAGAYDMMTTGR
jgi:hypothetical protein